MTALFDIERFPAVWVSELLQRCGGRVAFDGAGHPRSTCTQIAVALHKLDSLDFPTPAITAHHFPIYL